MIIWCHMEWRGVRGAFKRVYHPQGSNPIVEMLNKRKQNSDDEFFIELSVARDIRHAIHL